MEYVMNILVRWQSNDDGTRTLAGITPVTQNSDGGEPQPVFIPVSKLNEVAPSLVHNMQTGVMPTLIAARDAQVKTMMPPEQAAARAVEEATVAKAALDTEIAARRTELDDLDKVIAERRAEADAAITTEA